MKQVVTERIVEAQSLAATFQTAAFPAEAIYSPFIQIVVSGASSLDIDFTVQGTSDFPPGTGKPQNWVTLTEFASKAVTSDGTYYWYLPEGMLSMKAIRIVGTNTAGTGSAAIIISGVRL